MEEETTKINEEQISVKFYWDNSDLENGREVNGDFSKENIFNGKKETRAFKKIKDYINSDTKDSKKD